MKPKFIYSRKQVAAAIAVVAVSTVASLFGLCVLATCSKPLEDAPPVVNKPVKLTAVQVRLEIGLVPTDTYYEFDDAPAHHKAMSAEEYAQINPKNNITVYKINGAEKTLAENSEYTVVISKDSVPQPTTKLTQYGSYELSIVWKADAACPVRYVLDNVSNVPSPGATGIPLMVAGSSATGAQLVKYQIQRQPNKKVYDFKEEFDPAGMEVIAWHGGESISAGGIPIIAIYGVDYVVDTGSESVNGSFYEVQQRTVPVEGTFNLYVEEPSATPPENRNGQGTGVNAGFSATITAKRYTISGAVTNGDPIDIRLKKGGDSVTIQFKRALNPSIFNPDNIKLCYGNGLEVSIAPFGGGLNNSLGAAWKMPYTSDNYTNNTSIEAVLTMPISDITVTGGEFMPLGNKLDDLSIVPSVSNTPPSSYQTIFNFAPTLATYYVVLANNQDYLFLKATAPNGASIHFADDPNTTMTINDDTSGNATASGFDASKDNIITITVSSGSLYRDYKVIVKKFDSNNTLYYRYNGTKAGDGSPQTFIPPEAGDYQFETWGAYGGNAKDYHPCNSCGGDGRGGSGGYSKGTLTMDPNKAPWNPAGVNRDSGRYTTNAANNYANAVYIYVGEGGWAHKGYDAGPATYNGGGAGAIGGGSYGSGASAGGATSVSLTRGPWSDFQVLLDRIMVAGGGGGYGHNNGRAGAAGGLEAQGGRVTFGGNYNVDYTSSDANTTVGVRGPTAYAGTIVTNNYWNGATQFYGSGRKGQGFGRGGDGPTPPSYAGHGAEGRGAGGGGYWGGEVSWAWSGEFSNAGGGGGSGYVSGHSGCVSYDKASTPTNLLKYGEDVRTAAISVATNDPYHYSGRFFTNTYMNIIINVNAIEQGVGSNDIVSPPSPAIDPFNSGLGNEGQKNRDGIVRITRIP
ncbi:MAG: hypothetical protein LBG74_08205 [Spirochaetaceae bacterium]|jgi:hypothetical protein|nr:hypothetical protein [Spirochaetaceae bacterium]